MLATHDSQPYLPFPAVLPPPCSHVRKPFAFSSLRSVQKINICHWSSGFSLEEHNFSSPVQHSLSFQICTLNLQDYGMYFCLYFIYVLLSQRGVSPKEFG